METRKEPVTIMCDICGVSEVYYTVRTFDADANKVEIEATHAVIETTEGLDHWTQLGPDINCHTKCLKRALSELPKILGW